MAMPVQKVQASQTQMTGVDLCYITDQLTFIMCGMRIRHLQRSQKDNSADKQVIPIRLALCLQIVQFLVFILLVLPFYIAKQFNVSQVTQIGLTKDMLFPLVIVAQLIGIGYSYIFIRKRLAATQSSWADLGVRRFPIGRSVKYFFGYYVIIICFLVCLVAVINVLGLQNSSPESPSHETIRAIGGMWPNIITAVILAPIIEEVLFRGIVYTALRRRHGVLFSAVTSGLIFGIMHLDPRAGLLAVPIGIYLGYMYERLASIVPGMIVHASWNLLVTMLILHGK